jgi:hypothetical protein
MKRWLMLLLVVTIPLVAPATFGQVAPASKVSPADIAEARRLFRAAARAYEAGRFDVAAQTFDQAYELAPRAAIRFSAAQALRRLYASDPDPAHLQKALAYYRQYLDEVKEGRRVKDAAEAINALELLLAQRVEVAGGSNEPPPVTKPARRPTGTLQLDSATPGAVAIIAGRRPLAALPKWVDLPPGSYHVTVRAKGFQSLERRVRIMAGRVTVVDSLLNEVPAELELTGEADADVVVDGRAVGRTPLSRRLRLPSGRHGIAVGRSGRTTFFRELELERGERRVLDVELGMTVQRGFAWGFLASAAGATVTGLVLVGLSAKRLGDAKSIAERRQLEQRDLSVAEAEEHNGDIDTAENLQRAAVASFATGLAAAGLGLTLYLFDEPDLYRSSDSSGPDLSASIGPRGFSLGGRF